MPKFRILPLLIVGVTGLLCLKASGLALHGGYLFTKASVAEKSSFERSLSVARNNLDDEYYLATNSVPEKKPKKDANASKDEKLADASKMDNKPVEAPVTQSPPLPPSGTERQLMEKLKDRRSDLEMRSKELDLRENLLKATEKKIEDRIEDLKGEETRADVTGTSRAKAEKENMRPLVIMYEFMKPKEAARVFEKLDIKVLVQVTLAMNPRKMADVLAAMSPDSAEKLTTALALRNIGDMNDNKSDQLPAGELPRLDAKK